MKRGLGEALADPCAPDKTGKQQGCWQPGQSARSREDDFFLYTDQEEVKAMLQALVDVFWDFGIRPTGVEDFRRSNDTLGNHLKDMRAIVAKKLDVELS